MDPLHGGLRSVADDRGDIDTSAAALFTIIWDAIADVLGTASVAALVRRATHRASEERPDLVDVVVVRERLEYRCRLPFSWQKPDEGALVSLRVLAAEMGRLLNELTGNVIIVALEQIPVLRACGIVWRKGEST